MLLWLTDGVEPGPIHEPMEELRQAGVTVMALSTGSGNYQVLRRVVSPPVEDHLHFVDVDDISIITEDLRDAIIGKTQLVRYSLGTMRGQTSNHFGTGEVDLKKGSPTFLGLRATKGY